MKRFFLLIILTLTTSFFCEAREVGKVKKIVIDPGHGGNKPGAVTKKNKEKDITLSVALKVGKLLSDNCKDVEVIFTRKTDVDVDLFKRAQIANRNKADLFISIHVNSSKSTEPVGTETFVMGLSKSTANLEVAKKENADILLEDNYKENYQGFDPNSPEGHIMFALYQNAYIDKSLDFAYKIQTEYAKRTPTKSRDVKQAEFIVIYKTAMPSVLTEIGFMSNPDEEEYLVSAQGQGEIAYSIFNAIREYKAQEENTELSSLPTAIIDIEGYNPNEKYKAHKTTKTEALKTPAVASASSKPKENVKTAEKTTPTQKDTTVVRKIENPTISQPKEEFQNGIDYRVQILISKEKLPSNSPKFKGLQGVAPYEQDGVFRYTYGRVGTIDKAKVLLDEVKEKKFKDAFIISFKDNKRITLQEALSINDSTKK